jgi:hypothetical protein
MDAVLVLRSTMTMMWVEWRLLSVDNEEPINGGDD